MMKVEYTKDGPRLSQYTKEDEINDLIRDLIRYTDKYRETKWWQLIKQHLIVNEIRHISLKLQYLCNQHDQPI